jgi:hypothetical protein
VKGGGESLAVRHYPPKERVDYRVVLPLKASSLQSTVTATYLTTLSRSSFTGARNSVALLSPTSFYLSHDHRFTLGRSASPFGLPQPPGNRALPPLSRADLVYLSLGASSFHAISESVDVRTVANGIALANRVTLSRSRTTVAVAM